MLLELRDKEAAERGARGAQRRAAEAAGLSEAQMSRILKGENVSPATFASVSSKLQIPPDALRRPRAFVGDEPPSPNFEGTVWRRIGEPEQATEPRTLSDLQIRQAALDFLGAVETSNTEEIRRIGIRLARLCLAVS